MVNADSPKKAHDALEAELIVEPETDEGDPQIGDDEAVIVDVSGEQLALRDGVLLANQSGEWRKDQQAPTDELAEARGEVGDLYRQFSHQASLIPRLSEEEEAALGKKVMATGDKDAAKKLVVHNLRLAIKMAHQYRRSWANLMDLVQEASAGLAIAAERWDPDKGTRFGTYAAYWIRAQLSKFLMTHGRVIHTGNTRAGRKLYFQLPKIRARLLAAGREASIANIAAEVGEDEAEVARVVARLDMRETSTSSPTRKGDDGATLGDGLEGSYADPESQAAKNEMAQVLQKVTASFGASIENERDRAIWFEHLLSSEPVSLVDLGKRYGVSKQRMGQLAVRLKRAFRRHIIDELGPDTQLSWLFAQD